jgi:hypothetical protein
MTEQVPDSGVAKIGHSIMTALGRLLTWLTAGWSGAISAALTALLSLLGAICSLVFSVLYARYPVVLGSGAEPEGSPERKAYDDLRDSLVADNRAGRLYVDWLTGCSMPSTACSAIPARRFAHCFRTPSG